MENGWGGKSFPIGARGVLSLRKYLGWESNPHGHHPLVFETNASTVPPPRQQVPCESMLLCMPCGGRLVCMAFATALLLRGREWNRTTVGGFAILSLATRPRDPLIQCYSVSSSFFLVLFFLSSRPISSLSLVSASTSLKVAFSTV